ncbi:hypothetical protein [Staphylococcus gallinarum]|uniref:hypothetical protein n=1 Tax=Staphylococcus gallinarum TaxID=1293 RepID=UPI000D1DC60F|nr:hypothetical protein [Staphylococcus gallinarum]PTK88185.1 hypothetical protein BUZ05_13850 [Staphylococcus gallinarum]PTK94073.1 hypothetical protein BUZ13_05270 [Staphylococcus gallinarum]RIO88282.1 hypothetical protein BUZ06_07965 [Staphylococcus gallinarum]
MIVLTHALIWIVMLFFLPNDIVMQKKSDGSISYTLPKQIAAIFCIIIAVIVYILCLLPKVEHGKVTNNYQDQFVIISIQIMMLIVSVFIIINALIH